MRPLVPIYATGCVVPGSLFEVAAALGERRVPSGARTILCRTGPILTFGRSGSRYLSPAAGPSWPRISGAAL